MNEFDFSAAAMEPWEAWLRDFIALGLKLLLEALPPHRQQLPLARSDR